MAASVTEIAKKAGVSKGLVSRVLRQDENVRVSDARRQQILSVAKMMGGVARSTSGRAKRQVLSRRFVIPVNNVSIFKELQAHWEGQAFNAIKKVLSEHGFKIDINLHETDSTKDVISEYTKSRGSYDGLLLLGGIADRALADFLLENEIAHVCTDRSGRVLGLNTIVEDLSTGFYQAVAHLKELGHTRIGFLGRRRYAFPSFISAMALHDLLMEPEWHCMSPREGEAVPEKDSGWREAAQRAFGQWLDDGGSATAICCHNDYGALGAMDAMKERGLTPGREISIVGSDNMEARGASPVAKPVMTTLDFSLEDLGRRTAQLLLNQVLYKQGQIVHEQLPVQLVIRKTTGPCLNR